MRNIVEAHVRVDYYFSESASFIKVQLFSGVTVRGHFPRISKSKISFIV